jgi:hypothetical protein
MDINYISGFEVGEDDTLWIILENEGKSEFQYVYRAGKGIYWDSIKNGFRFDTKGDEDYSKWFVHLLSTIKTELCLEMRPGENLVWNNVPATVRLELLQELNVK